MKKLSLTHPFEIPYYCFAVISNIVIPVGIVLSGVLIENWSKFAQASELAWFVLTTGPVVVMIFLIKRIIACPNGILLSREQFPEVYTIAEEIAWKFEMKQVPEIYLYTGDTSVKTASGVWGRKAYILLNSPVCKMAEENREGLAFLLGREYAHLKLGHYTLANLLSVMFVSPLPLLGSTLNRLRTYSCDRYGASVSPEGVAGLLFLVADRLSYQHVNVDRYLEQGRAKRGVWAQIVGLFIDQPYYEKRIKVLYDLGLFVKERKTDTAIQTFEEQQFEEQQSKQVR